MEARSAYGYWGSAGGVTGETPPTTHKSGWRFSTFYFEIAGTFHQTGGCKHIEIKACDYAHAVKQAKQWAKRDGFTIVGDEVGHEIQRTF